MNFQGNESEASVICYRVIMSLTIEELTKADIGARGVAVGESSQQIDQAYNEHDLTIIRKINYSEADLTNRELATNLGMKSLNDARELLDKTRMRVKARAIKR